MTYKEKLKAWNSTDKYKRELDFLYGLISPKDGGRYLDFGAGILTAVENFNARQVAYFYGYDVKEYGEQSQYHLYDRQLNSKYDAIYLMHSLAHIKYPITALKALRDNLSSGGTLIVITPNLNWMDADYNGDSSVVKHYTSNTLSDLLKDSGYTIHTEGQFGEVRGGINERLFIKATL